LVVVSAMEIMARRKTQMFNSKVKSNGNGNGNGHGPGHGMAKGDVGSRLPTTAASAPAAAPTPEAATAPAAPAPMTVNVIGKGTVIDGNISAEGDLTVEGTVRGDVTTKTKLIAGPGSLIEGNLTADHAEIAGRVKGTVNARGLLVIKTTCVIEGDVITRNLNVESGSTFNGRFQVGGPSGSPEESVFGN
jgi:cytoskeletal protein CcmA (bactofilin family)